MNKTAPLYTQTMQEHGTIPLPECVFGVDYNPNLIHQVVISLGSNERRAIASSER